MTATTQSFMSVGLNLLILSVLSLPWVVVVIYCLNKLLIYLTYNANPSAKILSHSDKLFISMFPVIVLPFPLSCGWRFSSSSILFSGSGLGLCSCSGSGSGLGSCSGSGLGLGLGSGRSCSVILGEQGSLNNEIKGFDIYNAWLMKLYGFDNDRFLCSTGGNLYLLVKGLNFKPLGDI